MTLTEKDRHDKQKCGYMFSNFWMSMLCSNESAAFLWCVWSCNFGAENAHCTAFLESNRLGCFTFYETKSMVPQIKDYCVLSLEWPFFHEKLNDHLSQSLWKFEFSATLFMWTLRSGNSVSSVLNKLSSCVRLVLSQRCFLLASNWKQNGWKCHICSQTLNRLWKMVVDFFVKKMIILNSEG